MELQSLKLVKFSKMHHFGLFNPGFKVKEENRSILHGSKVA